jgi:hypothetical protein
MSTTASVPTDSTPLVYEYESACLRFRCYDAPDVRWLMWETRSGYPKGDEVTAVLRMMDAAMADGVPFVSVIDCTELPPVSAAPSAIPLLHEWVKRHVEKIDELTLSSSCVLKESFWSPLARKVVDAVQKIAPPKAPFLLTHSRELAEVFVTSERKAWTRTRGDSYGDSVASTVAESDESPRPDHPSSPLSSMRRSSTMCSFKSCNEIEPPNTLGIEQSDQIYFEVEELEDEKRYKSRTCGTCGTFPSWWTACFAR